MTSEILTRMDEIRDIIKDRNNKVIGFERLNFTLESDQDLNVEAIAVQPTPTFETMKPSKAPVP
jgi:hypothetical protein